MKSNILVKSKNKSLKKKLSNKRKTLKFNSKNKNAKFITVKHINDFIPLSKGISYTVEKYNNKDIIKKYINGVLVKQKAITNYKIFSFNGGINKVINKAKTVVDDNPKTVIAVEDKTSFFQYIKSGFGSGLGLAVAFESVGRIFDAIFDGE